MKKGWIFCGLLIAQLLLSPLPCLAGERTGAFSVSPFTGGYSYDGIQHFRSAPVYGLRLGYDITKNWATEVVFDFATTNTTQTHQGFNIFSYRLDVLYNFMPERALVPYLAVGGGGSYKEPKNDPEFNDATFNIGGGLKYFITDSVALRGDVRQLFIFGGETLSDWEYTVGVTFLFGGVKPVPPRQKTEPVAMPAAKPEPIPEPAAKAAAKPEPITGPVTKPVTKVEPAPVPKAPPAPVEAVEPEPDATKNRMVLNILFYMDTAIILDESRDEIGRVAVILRKIPTAAAVFEGHEAGARSTAYNIALSRGRVESVVNYLVEKFGIERSRISFKGYGEARPTAKSVPPGRPENKRSVNVVFDCVIVSGNAK